MTLFNIEIGKINIPIEDIPKDKDKWLIISDEKYRPDKEKFVFDRFKKDFKHIPVSDVSRIYAICSRSAKLSEWLASVNLEYALEQNEPTFYKSQINPKDWEKVTKEIAQVRISNQNKAEEEFKAAERYREELDKIKQKYSEYSFSMKQSRVITMNSAELPLTIQMAIENYTPATKDSPDKRAYARECLIRYKISLLDLINKDPDVEINKIIESNYIK